MKKIIIKIVRLLCKLTHNEYLIILDGISAWHVKNNKHIRDVAYYHKETENILESWAYYHKERR